MTDLDAVVGRLTLHLRDHSDTEMVSVDGYTKECISVADLRALLAALRAAREDGARERDAGRREVCLAVAGPLLLASTYGTLATGIRGVLKGYEHLAQPDAARAGEDK